MRRNGVPKWKSAPALDESEALLPGFARDGCQTARRVQSTAGVAAGNRENPRKSGCYTSPYGGRGPGRRRRQPGLLLSRRAGRFCPSRHARMVGRSRRRHCGSLHSVGERNAAQFEAAGQGMTEYIIVVALVAVAAIAVYQYFGQVVRAQVAAMAHELSGEDGSASLRAGGRPRRRQRAKPGPCHSRPMAAMWRAASDGAPRPCVGAARAGLGRGPRPAGRRRRGAGRHAQAGQDHRAARPADHAVDAAAYSGALQARHLNAIAYANRSQIAHQVAMAHLVTLAASARYLDSAQRPTPQPASQSAG